MLAVLFDQGVRQALWRVAPHVSFYASSPGNDALVDLESYTNARWGLDDGIIEWADLGPTAGSGCN